MRRLIIALSIFLCDCTGPRVTGNEDGRVILGSATVERQVMEAAQVHCARYRRDVRITSIQAEAGGGKVLFQCIKSS